MMSIHVLSTALQYNLPVVFVVMNNSELGMVRHGQGDRCISSEFAGDNFAKIAESFGCCGIHVDKPSDFSSTLREAFASSKPTVIDVIIDREENFEEIKTAYRGR
jgi:acetolactate synthase-1/2/3 large subunit